MLSGTPRPGGPASPPPGDPCAQPPLRLCVCLILFKDHDDNLTTMLTTGFKSQLHSLLWVRHQPRALPHWAHVKSFRNDSVFSKSVLPPLGHSGPHLSPSTYTGLLTLPASFTQPCCLGMPNPDGGLISLLPSPAPPPPTPRPETHKTPESASSWFLGVQRQVNCLVLVLEAQKPNDHRQVLKKTSRSRGKHPHHRSEFLFPSWCCKTEKHSCD